MRNKILPFILATLILFSGCAVVKDYFDRHPIQEVVARLAVRSIAYAIVDKNPDLKPYFILTSQQISDPESAHPDSVKSKVFAYIETLDISENQKQLLKLSTLDVIDVYTIFYLEHVDELSSSDFYSVLSAITQAVEEGARLAGHGLVGLSGPRDGLAVKTSQGLILVE